MDGTVPRYAFGKTFDELEIGMIGRYSRQITDDDIALMAQLSGDHNFVHTDEALAKRTVFKGRIVHGLHAALFLSTALAQDIPGPGTIYIRQELEFLFPVRPNDTVDALVQLTAKDELKRRIHFKTTCFVGDKVVIEGFAIVGPPRPLAPAD